MKTKHFNQLQLNKQTIANLNRADLEKIKGGESDLDITFGCPSYTPNYTCYVTCHKPIGG